MSKCKHWSRAQVQSGGMCAKFDRTVSAGVCQHCVDYDGPARGVGDAVAKVTKFVGIRPCGGCQHRRELLNKAFPFRRLGGGLTQDNK